jgi:predicted MFS family arabinose efflux permease
MDPLGQVLDRTDIGYSIQVRASSRDRTPMAAETVSRSRSALIVFVVFFAMAIAIFGQPAIGVLSTFIIDEFDITRTEIGWLAATASLFGAVLSPVFGRVTDSIGGKPALLLLFTISAIGLVAFGLAPEFGFLLGGAALVGISQAGANPATNILIGDLIEPGRRGLAIGIKQSGVQAGFLIGGLALPGIALGWGWRAAFLLAGGLAGVGVIISAVTIPASHREPKEARGERRRPLPHAIRWLATYAFFMGLSAGALVTYLPLFAQESLDYHVTTAGIAVAVIGSVAVVARIVWAHISEQTGRFAKLLGLLSVLALIAVVGLYAAWIFDIPWLLWPSVAIIGLSSGSWNAPAMTAVIVLTSGRDPGRASGMVVLGFASGLTLGPPAFGYLVDATGEYGLGLLALAAWFLVAALVSRLWDRRDLNAVA